MLTPDRIENFADVQAALEDYWAARRRLEALGVVRSQRSVPGDFGEWLACQMLDLKLAQSGVQKGYDATDAAGQTYQVKVRIVHDLSTSTSFDFKSFDHPFDFLIGVFVSLPHSVLAVVRVPFAEVVAHASITKDGPRLRWSDATRSQPWVDYLFRV